MIHRMPCIPRLRGYQATPEGILMPDRGRGGNVCSLGMGHGSGHGLQKATGGDWTFSDLTSATVYIDISADFTGDISGDLVGRLYDQGPHAKELRRGDNYLWSYHLTTNANLNDRAVLKSPGVSGVAYTMYPNGGVPTTGASWAICIVGDNRAVAGTWQKYCGESQMGIWLARSVGGRLVMSYYSGEYDIGTAPLGPFALLIECVNGWVTTRHQSGLVEGPTFTVSAADARWKLTNLGGYWLGGSSQCVDNGDLARLTILDGALVDADRAGFFSMVEKEYAVP